VQQISLQFLAWFTNYNNLKLKVDFSKRARYQTAVLVKKITSANISISPPNLPDLNPTGVSCMKRNIGTLSEIRAQGDQYCQAEDCFVDDMERSAMEFIEREIVKFLNIFRTWVAAAGEKFKHSETYSTWGADIRH